jgi:Uma2 family endonuclease
MSVLAQSPSFLLQPPPYPIHKLSIAEYHRMLEVQILTDDDPVELLEGWLVPKMPHKPPHDGTIQLAEEVLRPRLPTDWRLRIQSAITTDDSEPEPDVTVVAGEARTYLHRHPGPADIAVLLEVAETTLQRDREDKGRLYARARIACYWIVNLVDRQVEVNTDPTGPDPNPHYRQVTVYKPEGAIPLVIGGQDCGTILVRDLLP